MNITVPRSRRKIRLSVSGLSFLVLTAFACALLWLIAVWLSPNSSLLRGIATVTAIICVGARFMIASLSTMGELLVISDGMRDSYVAAEDLVSVSIGQNFGSITVVKVSYKKRQFGLTRTKCVRTLVWRKEATAALRQIDSVFAVSR
jgi:hypothetical protein